MQGNGGFVILFDEKMRYKLETGIKQKKNDINHI